jgi:heptosyltransferase-2
MKILIVKLSSLGDVLVSSPLPRLICELSQDYSVDHLVMDHCAPITKFNPYVKNQIVVPFVPSGSRLRDLRSALGLVKKIRQIGYDKAFIFHRSPLIALLLKLSGVQEIYGFENHKNYFLHDFVRYSTEINRTTLEVNLLHAGGLPVRHPEKLDFYPDPKCRPIGDIIPKHKFISCNPGGGNKHAPADNRMWPLDHYIETIRRLESPVVILGHGEADSERARIIERAVPERVTNLVGKTSISESAEIIRCSSLYLGNDSSLSFLAAAVGVKSVTLFGPTQVVAALPIGMKQYFLKGSTPCSPCYDPLLGMKGSMYTCKNNECMQSISPLSVIECIQNIEIDTSNE